MRLLTNNQLEVAARRVCALRDLDPEERVLTSHPEGYAVAWRPKRVQVLMDELSKLNELIYALNSAQGDDND